MNILTVIGFGLPIIGYFRFLSDFRVNAIIGDQWSNVALIKQSYRHFFDWGLMWTQHNENRMLFPNMIVLLLARTAHFDIRLELTLSAIMLMTATGLIVWTTKRRSSSTPWLYFCPIAVLALSVAQSQNTLWGFQIAWYMVLLALATTLLILDRDTLTWLALGAAIVVAVVGSFSSLQGLLIWPSGLVLLYFRRRTMTQVGVWIAAAIATTVFYFHNFAFSVVPFPHYVQDHPLASVKFFLFLIGDVVGKPATYGPNTFGYMLVVLFGLALVVLAVGTVLIGGFRATDKSSGPVGIALILFGLLFAALVTQGRAFSGYVGASASRYTTFDLLIPIGIYVALLGRRQSPTAAMAPPASARGWRVRDVGGWSGRVALPYARILVLVLIAVQVPFGIEYGLQRARGASAYDTKSVSVLRNVDRATDGEIDFYLYPFAPPSYIRELARTLEVHQLSVFATK